MIRNKRLLFGKMKPCCRLISNCRNLSIFASQSSNYKLNLGGYRKIHSYPFQILGFPGVIQLTHKISCWKETNFGQFDVHCRVRSGRDDFRVRCVVCDERIFSTTSGSGINDKRFEKGCIQAGVNVKPLLVAKDGNEENVERQVGDVVEVNDGGVGKGVKIEVSDGGAVDTGNKKEAFVNDRRFKKGYIQGGVNIKPSVASKNGIEKILERQVGDFVQENDGVAEVASANEKERECGKKAWRLIRNAVVTYRDNPIGTVAANDPDDNFPLNYDQVFIRDFIPSALAFLMKGEGEIVKNFLLHTLELQSCEKTVDCYSPVQGLMPASFKVTHNDKNGILEEVLDADFGESAIGRVAPVDSGLWWIILLKACGKLTGDYTIQEREDVQTGIRLILNVCLSDGFDMFPTLLVTDGSCMFDK